MTRPKRRWTIDVHASGDEWVDAVTRLRELADHVEEHGQACEMVMGGHVSSGYVHVRHDPDMTHEKYGQALDAYLAAQRTGEEK